MAKLKTFQASYEDVSFGLSTHNINAAQHIKCQHCGEKWKSHFAGKSDTIPQGTCPKYLPKELQ